MQYEFSDRLKNLGGNAIREIFKLLAQGDVISFAGGFPTLELIPVQAVKELTDELLSGADGMKILQYGETEGYLPLRKTLLSYVNRYGIYGQTLDNTIVVSGGQQTIDLTCKAFINKGDFVLVEEPTYLAVLHILKTYEANVVGVRSDEDGLNLADLEAKIQQYHPKLIYLVPTFSNPTGKTLSVEKRKAIADLTAKYSVMLLEDDPYSELRFEGERVPAIKSFETGDNIIFTASFSKTIAPGLRTAMCFAPKDVTRKLTIGKQASDVHTGSLNQAIVNAYLQKGYMEQRLPVLIPVYKQKKDAMMAAISKYMPSCFHYTNPEGGLFIWGSFDVPVDTTAVFADCVQKTKVAYVAGDAFFADGKTKNCLRLNYSNATVEQIEDGMKRLGGYFCDLLGK